ncbi:MAG TPA: hypothetical protein VLF67_00685 [Candidatus Saccharimonas sp.]|nr:hypothetical protein [Candidatus Saccharimonas sp.]
MSGNVATPQQQSLDAELETARSYVARAQENLKDARREGDPGLIETARTELACTEGIVERLLRRVSAAAA